jgi:hypothetical protein
MIKSAMEEKISRNSFFSSEKYHDTLASEETAKRVSLASVICLGTPLFAF